MNCPFIIGQRVQLRTIWDVYPLGTWPVGTTGTVTEIDPAGFEINGTVKLDQHFTALDEWDNCLHVSNDPNYPLPGWDVWESKP